MAKQPTPDFNVGDRVEYKAAFLRSIGWYTNVSTDGIVFAAPNQHALQVQWPDGRVVSILASNLIHKNRLHLEPH